ncbi:MAG: glutaminase A [Firmicutes bacterium]|nr:glutaminase A [Bacillota bacterium]
MPNSTINNVLWTAYQKGQTIIPFGNVATYIPELGKARKNALGVTMLTKDGRIFELGDTDTRFTIQSISKVISLIVALETFGISTVFDRVGMEPSGEAFNSLVELDLNSNKPYNPMINSGAITIASMLLGHADFESMLEKTRALCHDPEIDLNEEVYASETANMSRNKSIAYLLESKDIIYNDVDESLELYTKMCSLNVTTKSLANLGIILAMDGLDPATGQQVIRKRVCETVKTIMLTCGMYDGSGEFAVRVGMPSKSGVGGGLLSVADDKVGIGIYGPSLDEKGNCIAGRPILEYLSKMLRLHIFDPDDIVTGMSE